MSDKMVKLLTGDKWLIGYLGGKRPKIYLQRAGSEKREPIATFRNDKAMEDFIATISKGRDYLKGKC